MVFLCYSALMKKFQVNSARQALYLLPGILLALTTLLIGCQKEPAEEFTPGKVEATEAYLDHFGVPPQGKAGRAYARVGYLPSRENPTQLVARPIFIFSEQDELQKILEKLISGDLIFESDESVYSPFPAGLSLTLEPITGKTLHIMLATTQGWSSGLDIAASALAETALQFDEVRKVKVSLNGSPPPDMPEEGYSHNGNLIGKLDPPTLILMLAAWEKDEKDPKEILIEFDRPIKVQKFELSHENGKKVEGDYYISIFKMAVVVRPKQPELFEEGSILKAKWSVVDELGRANSGVSTMPLGKDVH